jgi:predicted methyltransferase
MEKINYEEIIENDFEEDFYRNLHRKIIDFINQNKITTFQEIVKTIGGSDRRILRLLNEMVNSKEILLKDRKIFSKVNQKEKLVLKDIKCQTCDSKIISLNGKLDKVKKIIEKIYIQKPIPTFVYDQRPVNADTTVRRAAYLLWRNDLIGKEIVVLGDDDLTSLAIGLIGGSKKITVLDIDSRIINFINKISKKYSLPITAIKYDFTKKIPEKLKNKFDVFLTDPTPNKECFSMFISLGLELLKQKKDKVGYISFFPSHQEMNIDFQKVMTKKELIITDMIPRFTEYDFIEFTYNENDKKILQKFDSGENKISFYENITRFITTEKTFNKKKGNIKELDYEFGKSTKKILKDPTKDPAFLSGEEDFVLKAIKEIKNEI